MKKFNCIFFMIFFALSAKAQYPFELLDSIKYQKYSNWIKYDWSEKKKAVHHTLTIRDFYKNHDSLTIQLSSFINTSDSSYIRIFRNKIQEQKLFEPMAFPDVNFWNPLMVADFNGDSLKDLKLIIPYMGCGLAGMNMRIIYLFQTADGKFKKISFLDKLEDYNRVERDLDKDGNFEIITMTLQGYQGHNYWTFDLFNYVDGVLKNVDEKFNYPIMIQYLNKPNYKITDKISRSKMTEFKLKLPEEIDVK